jgi:choline dehydrogenase-like flavoprotein
MESKYDVIVVGAGTAGAITAWKVKALRPATSVLLLDAGDNLLDATARSRFVNVFSTAGNKDALSPYQRLETSRTVPSPDLGTPDKHYVQAGPDRFKSNYVRMVGGSTWAWRGNCPRWVPADFELRSRYGVGDNWPVSYAELEPYFCVAEEELGVSGNHEEQQDLQGAFRSRAFPMDAILQAVGDKVVKDAVEGKTVEGKVIKVVATPQARNSRRYQDRSECRGNANCIPICPSGAKYDASVHIKKFLDEGKKAGSGRTDTAWRTLVTRLDVGPDGKIRSVHYRDARNSKAPEKTVEARVVILAGNAIESPRLWLASSLKNNRDLVGRFLMDHLAGEVTGYCNDPIWPFRGPQNTSSVFEFRDGDFRKTSAAFNVTIGNDGWGRKRHPFSALDESLWDPSTKRVITLGADLQKELAYGKKAVTKMIRVGYSTEQLPEPDNRVTLGEEKDDFGIPKPRIAYKVSDYSIRALEMGHRAAHGILSHVTHNIDEAPEAMPAYNGAGHPMGTLRMGASASNSVVNEFGRSHAHPNLYVVGSSIFVTGSSVNPTLLLAALALRTAEEMIQGL